MAFDTLNLDPEILKAIAESGYTDPTEVQSKAIPEILSGTDIRASAQTGTGKTAAFLLPALNLLTTPSEKPGKGPRVLILVPTRELAMQVAEQHEKYSKYLTRAKSVCIFGGVPYHKQTAKLSRFYDVLIATPGRLIDLMNQGKIDLSRIEMLILDEADRMLDMGFVDPVEQIAEATPTDRQTLLFSATLQGSVLKLSKRIMNNPIDIVVHAEQAKHENIEQKLLYVDDLYHKNRLLDHILAEEGVNFTIIFTSTKRHADQLVEELYDKGHRAGALHGDMNQRQRTRTIEKFKKGNIDVLVATDVAARGLDVQSITHVINFDLPRQIEDYVHRIGRTGRAGAMGTALSFASQRDADIVPQIERFTGQKIEVIEIAGLEPSTKMRPKRSNEGSRSNRGPKRRSNSDSKRSFDRGPKRAFNSDSKRSFSRGPKRSSNDDSKPSFNRTPKQDSDRDSKRSFNRAPKQDFDRDSKRSFSRGPKRSSNDDSKPRFNRVPKQDSDRDSKRSFSRGPKRSFNDDSKASFSSGPKRTSNSDSKRSFSRGPKRQFKSGAKSSKGTASRPQRTQRSR